MKILVTGAKGFVGRNLCTQLNNIKSGKAKCYGELTIDEVFEYDLDSTPELLEQWCAECDFVFNLAGVNSITWTVVRPGLIEWNLISRSHTLEQMLEEIGELVYRWKRKEVVE